MDFQHVENASRIFSVKREKSSVFDVDDNVARRSKAEKLREKLNLGTA